MPDKPLDINKSLWLNFMREFRRKFKIFDHISRQKSYPVMAKFYNDWINQNIDGFKTKKHALQSIVKYVKQLK